MRSIHSYMNNLRLQTRISLFVSIGLIIILGLFTFVAVRVIRDTTDRILGERLVVTQMAAGYVDTILQEVVFELAKATTLAPFDPNRGSLVEEEHILALSYGHLGSFTQGVFLLDRTGTVVLASPPEATASSYDLPIRPFIVNALETGQVNISNAFLNTATNKPSVAVILPVRNDAGELISLLVGLLDLSSPKFANSLIAATRLGDTGHADIVDMNGTIVASSEPNHVNRPGEHPEFYHRMLLETKTGVETAPYDDEDERRVHGIEGKHVMAFVPLKMANWGIGLGGSEDETFAPVRRLVMETTLLAFLVLGLALILAWITTRQVVRPVEELIGAAERMAQGDLFTRIEVAGEGEIGRLAASFDYMRLKLQGAHNALTIEKSQYEGIFRHIADPVFTVDAEYLITSFNPAAELATGLVMGEVVGLHCSAILPGRNDQRPHCTEHCPLRADSGWEKSPVSTERLFTSQHGYMTFEATRSPIFDEDRNLVGVVHVLRDLTAREELDRMKEEFISNVSHELRSPLGHIKGYVTTLLRRDTTWKEDMQKVFFHEILQGTEKLQRLVADLLDSSRLESHTFSVEKQPTQVSQIGLSAARWVRSQTKKHKLRVTFPPDFPRALVDPHRIDQVLRNLLENAVKYSPDGGDITVSGSVVDNTIVVAVADQGLGIAQEQMDRIFDRFHRIDNSLVRGAGGIGLGLSICRGIVEAQGGRIWVESVLGEGSTFYISLPIFEEDTIEGDIDARTSVKVSSTSSTEVNSGEAS